MKTTPLAERLAAALHADICGSIDGGAWECQCGATGVHGSNESAAMALWRHRQEVHA